MNCRPVGASERRADAAIDRRALGGKAAHLLIALVEDVDSLHWQPDTWEDFRGTGQVKHRVVVEGRMGEREYQVDLMCSKLKIGVHIRFALKERIVRDDAAAVAWTADPLQAVLRVVRTDLCVGVG